MKKIVFDKSQKDLVKRYALSELEILLLNNEGINLNVYKCPASKNTIGIGHNIDDNPLPKDIVMVDYSITQSQAIDLLRRDIAGNHYALSNRFDWYNKLDKYPKIAVQDLVFNLGITAFLKFKKTIEYLGKYSYDEVASEILKSKYAKQLPNRSQLVSKLLSNKYTLSDLIEYK